MKTGLDVVLGRDLADFRGKSIAIVCHQASIASDHQLILDHFLPGHHRGDFRIQAVFGPQHGIWGHTQDNMIEWEGYTDPRTGLRFYSLYGEHREPTPEKLAGVDELVFDVQDVGARYYTFIWTLANCIKACAPLGIPVTVLDRPNPIGGLRREGPGHDPAFASFVGLYPLPVRHGCTVGEIGRYLQAHHFPTSDLRVVAMEGWERAMHFRDTGLPWAMPSPNMPTPETALVYPGQCLVEGTKLSEGRGTTMPFEMWGAPYLDGWRLAEDLASQNLPGVAWRPIQFQPTFHKFRREVCQGCFIHVTDREAFEPVLTTAAILQAVIRQAGSAFAWQDPPYEYETIKLPIDILTGSTQWREMVQNLTPLDQLKEWFKAGAEPFEEDLKKASIY